MNNHILIVEDESSIADAIVFSLKSNGYSVEWVNSSRSALELIEQKKSNKNPFHLCILDVGLPDQSGFELCKEIRKTSSVPIVFLTARAQEVDRIVGFELGGDDYICKPFSPRELVARVKAILKRVYSKDSKIEVNNSFKIDDDKKRIEYLKQTVALTRYEYGVLKTLVEHPGRVYTRDMLMTLVWDEPESAFDRTVDAHIKSIRSKLRSINSSDSSIITHRGIGYSLKDTV